MKRKPPTDLAAARRALEAKRGRLDAALRVGEAGRVLSAANEEKLRGALESIQAVLDAVATDATEAQRTDAARRLAESWSAAAWDACDGAYLLAGVISLMGGEVDEPDQLAMLQRAYDGLSEWIAAEVAEISQPPEADDLDLGLGPLFDMEGRRRRATEAVPLREAAPVPLAENAVRDDGTASIKIIAPGWGSSGYYPAEMLERDGPKVFSAGTKMFWDHPTLTEEVDRPERSLRDLAGTLTSDARYEAAGPAGAGLYGDVEVFGPFAEALDELAPHIGVSIRAWGKASTGTAEGQTGPIIGELTEAESVDYVTTPGAGGQVLQLFEAARRRLHTEQEADDVSEKDLAAKLAEAEQRAARAQEALLLRDARDFVTTHLRDAKVPDVTRQRLVASLSQNPPAKDGKLDEAALGQRADEALKAELEYLTAAAGLGRVRGFGGGPSDEDHSQVLQGAFQRLGLDESGAKIAAAGRR